MSVRHAPDRRLLLVALASVGRRNAATVRAAAPLPLGRKVCVSCTNVAVKGRARCRRCALAFIAPGPIAPCDARWFTWSPLAGYPKAMPIAPWVAHSEGADRPVFS